MNLIVGAPSWLILLLALTLIAAAVEDALRFRISNLTCAIVLITAFVAMGLHGLSSSLWQNALVGLIILIFGAMAFGAGWLGGGDVKLLAAIGLWLDLQSAVGLITAVFIAGGLVALAYILLRRIVPSRRKIDARHSRVPYGLAIVAGAAFIFTIQITDRHDNPFPDKMSAERTVRAASR